MTRSGLAGNVAFTVRLTLTIAAFPVIGRKLGQRLLHTVTNVAGWFGWSWVSPSVWVVGAFTNSNGTPTAKLE
jgi:hypothetical protein